MIFFICYYILGIVVGFYATANYFNVHSLFGIFIPVIVYTVVKEITRYYLCSKLSDNRILLILGYLFFTVIDIFLVLLANTILESKTLFFIVAHSILPIITQNIFCTYVSLHYGYNCCIYYMLVMLLFEYLFPIVPNPNDFLYSVIFLLTPIVFLYRIIKFTKKTEPEVLKSRLSEVQMFYYLPALVIILIFVFLVSGYFKYYSITIASGSMYPAISRGDVVVVDQRFKKNDLKVGRVIAFKYGKKIIVHRINNSISYDEKQIFYTKGDANVDADNYKVTEDMVVGVVKFRVPFVGYPTVLLNEIWSQEDKNEKE